MSEGAAEPLIHGVRVRDLFGRYNYDVEIPESGEPRLLLLHGENGSGKTTLLRLVWNLLSPSDRRGHRTYLSQTPFRELVVDLAGGQAVAVTKRDGILGAYDIRVTRPGEPELHAVYDVDDHLVVKPTDYSLSTEAWVESALAGEEYVASLLNRALTKSIKGRQEEERSRSRFLAFLEEAAINPLLLADDRSLYSDDVELERMRERAFELEAAKAGRRGPLSNPISRELGITLRRLNDFFRTLTIGGQNSGSAGANSIYMNVLRELASTGVVSTSDASAGVDFPRLMGELARIRDVSPRFEEFGLVPPFAADEFIGILGSVERDRRHLAVQILTPFLESLVARYEALAEPERKLRTLVSLFNDFLGDKVVTFAPGTGLTITTDDGKPLEPSSLSSGERQLTMLLSTTMLAAGDSRLFIIDEPELSLGVGWQRRILSALLELTEGSSMQFVVATHSVEILSGHRESLVRLVRSRDATERG